jgi:hypothetical protein
MTNFQRQLQELASTPSFVQAQRATEYEMAMRQRAYFAKHQFLAEERLSAEPRGNEVDLRKGRRR